MTAEAAALPTQPVTVAQPTAERFFESYAGGLEYSLRVPDMHLQFVVSRLHRNRDGLKGELTVKSTIPGARGYGPTGDVVFASNFNFSSGSTRKQVGNLLKERVALPDGGLDWYGYLEDLCQRVNAAENEGQPILEVGGLTVKIDHTMLLEPLLALRKPTILFGDGGVGKSMIAVGLALSVRLGRAVVPGITPLERGQVLYLDWETDEFDVDSRVKSVANGAGADPVKMLYRYCARPLAEGVEDLARFVRDHGVKLVVVDSAAAAMGSGREGGDANESVIRFFTAVRLLGCTTLIIDHVAKASAESFTGAGKPYGSTYKVNLARSTWEMRQARSIGDGAVHAALYHRKSNVSALQPGIGLSLHFEPERVWWEREAITNEDLIGSLPLAERLRIVLEEQDEMEVSALVDAAGSTPGAVRSALNRHPDMFASRARGRWTLIQGGRATTGTFRDAFPATDQ